MGYRGFGLAIAALWTAAAPAGAQPSPLDEVIAAERAFAADTRERGFKLGFLAAVAPDGFVFQPGPTPARPGLERLPDAPPPGPPLFWWPQFAGVANSGDLGFTTGGATIPVRYFTVWQRQPDGRWRWVLDRGRVVARGSDGQALRMVGTYTDIQQQKSLEDELRSQQALLRRAQRVAGMGSWVWEPQRGRVQWSDEFSAAIGWGTAALPSGRQWLRNLSKDARRHLFASWRRLLDDAAGGSFDLTWGRDPVTQQQLRIWVELDYDGAGALHRVLGQVQNISNQRRTDALIRWRTELLNRVSALGRIGGCEIEVDTRAMQWTEECYRIHGLRKAPVTLDQALDLYTPDSRDGFEAALLRIAEGGLPEQLDLCFYRPSGQRVWVQVLIELDQREGLPERYVVLFRDITRERDADERLELLAHYDLLTGLPNRMLLREQGSEAIIEARERGAILAMLFIDLDGF